MAFFNVSPQERYDATYNTVMQPADTTAAEREVAPDAFNNFGDAVGAGAYRGLSRGAAVMANSITPGLKELFGPGAVSDYLDQEQRKANQALFESKIDPATTGWAGQTLGQFADMAVTGLSVGGNPYAAGTLYGTSQGLVHLNEGMDPTTALGMAGIEGVGFGVMTAVPVSLAGGLFYRAATGGALNVAQGIPQRFITAQWLEARGYSDMAKQYEALDGTSMMADFAFGAFFGGLLGKRPAPSVLDAALVVNQQRHVEIDTAPGIPINTASRQAHVAAVDQSLAALSEGKIPQVDETVAGAQFLPKDAGKPDMAAVDAAMAEKYGADWREKLDGNYYYTDRPTPLGVDMNADYSKFIEGSRNAPDFEGIIRAEVDRIGGRQALKELDQYIQAARNRGIEFNIDPKDPSTWPVTKAQARQMVERLFNRYKDSLEDSDGNPIRTVDQALAKMDEGEIAMIAESEYDIYDRYLKTLPEEIGASDIVRALKEGTLPDYIQKKVTPPIEMQPLGAEVSRFPYAQKAASLSNEEASSLWTIANQRATKTNGDVIADARARLLVDHNIGGLIEKLGIDQKDLNAKLRSWSAWPAGATKLHDQINAGVEPAAQWWGLSNVSYLSKQVVDPKMVDSFVKSVEAPDKSWNTPDGNSLRSYIMRAFLGIDTGIEYSDLNFVVDSVLKPLGQYNSHDQKITIRANSPHTVAHEIGHYLDYKWGAEMGLGKNSALSRSAPDLNYIAEKNGVGPERIQFFRRFREFIHDIGERSDLRSEYTQDSAEVFARFIDQFVRWTEREAGVRSWGETHYNDKFHDGDFRRFAKLLQEKAYVDLKDGNPFDPTKEATKVEPAVSEATDDVSAWFRNDEGDATITPDLAKIEVAITGIDENGRTVPMVATADVALKDNAMRLEKMKGLLECLA